MIISEQYAALIKSDNTNAKYKHGDVRGELTVLYPTTERAGNKIKYVCRCKCGGLALVNPQSIKRCGHSCPLAKPRSERRMRFTAEEVAKIRAATYKIEVLALEYGCAYSTIWSIKNYRSYTDVP